MPFSLDEPKTWLASAFGVVAGLLGLITAWNARRLMTQHDGYGARIAALELHKAGIPDIGTRVALLEQQMAKKADVSDIGQVYEKLDTAEQRISARLTVLTDRIAEQHIELLDAVYENTRDKK